MRASGCNALNTNLDVPSRNLKNIKHKHTEQPAKQVATPYRVYVSPLVNRRGWTELIFKSEYMRDVLCIVIAQIMELKGFCDPDKGAFYVHVYLYIYIYIYGPTLEAAVLC